MIEKEAVYSNKESRQLHKRTGILRGQHVHIISFARSLTIVRLLQTNKSRHLPTTLELGKKRRCKILSFHSWQQCASGS